MLGAWGRSGADPVAMVAGTAGTVSRADLCHLGHPNTVPDGCYKTPPIAPAQSATSNIKSKLGASRLRMECGTLSSVRAQHSDPFAMGLVQTDALFKGNAEHGKDLRGIGSPGLVFLALFLTVGIQRETQNLKGKCKQMSIWIIFKSTNQIISSYFFYFTLWTCKTDNRKSQCSTGKLFEKWWETATSCKLSIG